MYVIYLKSERKQMSVSVADGESLANTGTKSFSMRFSSNIR